MRWIALALTLAACGKHGPPCADQARDLVAWLRPLALESDAGGAPMTDELVAAPNAPLARSEPAALAIAITASSTSVNGVPAADDAALGARLAEAQPLGNAPPGRVRIAIDGDVPMTRVVAIVGFAADHGFTDAGFVFARKRTATRPPDSGFTPVMDRIAHDSAPPTVRAQEIAREAARLLGPCKSYNAVFSSASRPENVGRSAWLVDNLEAATVQCGCKVDVPSLRSLFWGTMSSARPDVAAVVDVTLAQADPNARAIGGATWADAAPALIAAGKGPVRIVAGSPP